MADDVDVAQEFEMDSLNDSIKKIKDSMKAVNTNIFCVDCDNEIPEARRKSVPNAIRCISCQEMYEKESRRYAK